MQYAHSAKISVFAKEGEPELDICAALKKLSGLPSESFSRPDKKEYVSVARTVASGFDEEKIIILELVLSKQKQVGQFIAHLLSIIPPSDKELLR